MKLQFPEGFLWGSSTAAAQIETASAHNWRGLKAKDGYRFERTSDHEQRRAEDVQYIKALGQVYRCGVDWARLQKEAFAPFDPTVVAEYQQFFQLLEEEGVLILLVIHHFTHPLWFEEKQGWLNENQLPAFIDYARQCIEHFGAFIFNWNTFNEPNVYALNAYMLGHFPPHKKNYFQANRVLRHMGRAHDIVYQLIKERYPDRPVGISLNTATFRGLNVLGWLPARFTEWWFQGFAASFFKNVDYWGLSYYAYVPFAPFPITQIDQPGRLAERRIPHDKMWGYNPEGLGKVLRRFHKKYGKPIIITENGVCTADPKRRIRSIKDYLQVCHAAIADGVPLRGYIHWSTLDNFEWHLGPTYRFGLVRVDLETKERSMTEAGIFYSRVCKENAVEL
ncbi:MAG: family 1 glycosylhydrolase [Bacteroidota bacterium]